MNFFRRACCRLWYKKFRVILTIVLFAVILSVIAGILILYTNSAASLDYLEKGLRCSVTIKKASVSVYTAGGRQSADVPAIYLDDLDTILSGEYIERYNYSRFAFVKNNGLKKMRGERTYQEAAGSDQAVYWPQDTQIDASLYCLVDSEYDLAFTLNGYRLLSGSHITEDSPENACLVSEELLALNDLQIGDTIEFSGVFLQEPYLLKIQGIFQSPTGEYWVGDGASPMETVFIKYEHYANVFNQYTRPLTNEDGPLWVTLYLDSPDHMDAFIENAKNTLNIRNVYDTHFGIDTAVPDDLEGMDYVEAAEYYHKNRVYDIFIDREWYDMVAAPMERINAALGLMMAGMLLCAAIVMMLFGFLSMKERHYEFGTLLAMGETRRRIVLQVMLEHLVIFILSAAIGITVGSKVGAESIKTISDGIYSVSSYEQELDNAVFEDAYIEELEAGSYRAWDHVGLLDLTNRGSARIHVAPNIQSDLHSDAVLLYFLMTVLLSLGSQALQVAAIIKMKPARILEGKG